MRLSLRFPVFIPRDNGAGQRVRAGGGFAVSFAHMQAPADQSWLQPVHCRSMSGLYSGGAG